MWDKNLKCLFFCCFGIIKYFRLNQEICSATSRKTISCVILTAEELDSVDRYHYEDLNFEYNVIFFQFQV